MARKLVVEIVGDASSLQKSYATASRSTKAFGKEIEHATRGALSGTRVFGGLGRSLVFASSGFLAFQSVTGFLRATIDAAQEAGIAQRSLAAQMKASGESFRANREQVERTARSYAKFGFQDDEVIASLTVLERATKSINTAIRLQGLVADLARAKNMDLAAAAAVVGKVYGGQETALRRAVPGLAKNAHGIDLIREARAKLAGQAAANTTADERFSATLHETEQIIGSALLPILNKYLDSLSRWLDKMNRSGKLQKQTADVARDVAAAFKLAAGAIRAAADAIDYFNEKRVQARHVLGPLSFLLDNAEMAAKRLKNAAETSNKAWRAILSGHILSYPSTSFKGKPPGLRGPVGKPTEFLPPGLQGPITPAEVQRVKRSAEQLNQWFDAMINRRMLRAGLAPLQQQLTMLSQVAALLTQRIAKTKDITRKLNLEDQLLQVLAQRKDVRAQLAQQATDTLALGLQRAGLTETMSDDLAALDAIIANLNQRIKKEGKSIELEQQLIGYEQQRVDLRKQMAQQAQQALEARQFRGLGLGPGGETLPPGLATLRKELTRVRDAVKGTILDTRANRSLFANIASELAGHFGTLTDAVKSKIKEMLDSIDQQLKDHARNRTAFRHQSARAFVESLGLNLTPEQVRRIMIGYSGVGAGGTVPGGVTPAFVVNGDVHLHGVQDPKGLETQLHRRAKARAHRRRGRQ